MLMLHPGPVVVQEPDLEDSGVLRGCDGGGARLRGALLGAECGVQAPEGLLDRHVRGERPPVAPCGYSTLRTRRQHHPPSSGDPGTSGEAMDAGPGAGFFERGADRLGDQLQTGQVTHRGQDLGGVCALRGAFPHQSGLLEPGQREVEEAIGTVVCSETVAEVCQHTVVEPGIMQLHRHRILEVDAAANRLGGLPVRQAQQELQHADGGQLSRRKPRTPIPRIPADKVLVAPQPIQPVAHPYRRRTTRVARPRDLRGQRRNLLTGTRAEGQRAPRQLHRSSELPEHAR